MNRILTREKYLDTLRSKNYTKYTNVPKFNEAFANDVNWGDSWVGRLVNSIRRKAKISINLRRIDSLTKRLKSLFDELLESGKISVDARTLYFLTTLINFDELADRINRKEELAIIVTHVDMMIQQIQSYNLKDGDILVDKLNEFMEFLKGLHSEDDSEAENVEEVEEVIMSNITISDLFSNLYMLKSVMLLIGSTSIDDGSSKDKVDDKSIEVGKGSGYKEEELRNPNIAVYVNKNNQDKLGKITGHEVDAGKVGLSSKLTEEVKFAIDKSKVQNVIPPIKIGSKIKFKSGGKELVGTITQINGVELKLKLVDGKIFGLNTKNTDFSLVESFIFENIVIKGDDPNAVKAFTKLKTALNVLVDSKDKGLSIDVKWIDSILSQKDDEDVKKIVSGLYKTINSYLLGDKKSTLNPDKKKLFENFVAEYKLDTKNGYGVGKTQVAAEKISRFIFTCLKFTGYPLDLTNGDIGGYKLLGELGNKLKEFNTSITNILKSKGEVRKTKGDNKDKSKLSPSDMVSYDSKEHGRQEKEVIRIEGDKVILKGKDGEIEKMISDVTKVEEGKILKYKRFLNINESVDYSAVESKFNEIFDDETKDMFNITEETKKRLEESIKSQDSIIITNSDPIIEIARLFNRAWRLHTPGRIPSGRTDGRVSMSVFQEYENLGNSDGDPDRPGSGPYRNIELFEKWNEAVLSILGDTKYRTTIFSDDAKFAFVSGEIIKRSVVSNDTVGKDISRDAEKARPLGKILLRFINNLLADTQMYKSTGAMPKFIEEYFGISDTDLKKLSFSNFDDVKKNSEISAGIVTPKVKFVKFNEVFDGSLNLLDDLKKKHRSGEAGDLKGGLLRLSLKEGDVSSTRYLLINDDFLVNNTFYFTAFNGMPFERVQISPLIPFANNPQIKLSSMFQKLITNSDIRIKQSKHNFFDGKMFEDGIEEKIFKATKIEILVTEDGKIFNEGAKYLQKKYLLKIKEAKSSAKFNALVKNLKF